MVCFYWACTATTAAAGSTSTTASTTWRSGDERRQAIEVAANAASWPVGGTTMISKIEIDLQAAASQSCRSTSRARQRPAARRRAAVSRRRPDPRQHRRLPDDRRAAEGRRVVTIPVQAQDRIVQRSHVHRANSPAATRPRCRPTASSARATSSSTRPPDGGVRLGPTSSASRAISTGSGRSRHPELMRDVNFGGMATPLSPRSS